ncbi:MAG: hypothetical protein LUG62_06300 [Clostridiales bacterium]|nr:hypothetical protein [Clostridiales bacterium]
MINEEKVKVMTRLAMYEQHEGKTHLPVSRYYRSDYIGLALIKNFFLASIGYIMALAAVASFFIDFLMENIHKMDLILLGSYVLIGYIAVLVIYSILTYVQYSVRYSRAKKSVRQYYMDLTRLEKIYDREGKKASARANSRRV